LTAIVYFSNPEAVKALRIPDQIRVAVESQGWSMADLAQRHAARRTKRYNRSLLYKKLNGLVGMTTREAEELADTLRDNGVEITLIWPQAKSAA
jgi:hypothetical protein